MKKMILLSFAFALMISCSGKKSTSTPLVKIGSKVLTKDHMDGYEKALRLYPVPLSEYFPGRRATITQLVETEILSAKASGLKSSFVNSKDWQWKQQYFPAQMFAIDILPVTLGFTDDELSSYYNQHKDLFKKTVKDSSGKDSSFFQPLADAKSQVAERLFYAKYPPDSAFLSRFSASDTDETMKRNEWIYSMRNQLPQFFMKEYFKQEYGKPYPDSLSEVYGDGKIITPEDMNIILSWVPVERQDYYKSEGAKRELVEWLLKWKLFAIHARKSGMTETPIFKSTMDWALKIECVSKYVTSTLVPSLLNGFSVDTSMVKYALYDDGYTPGATVDAKAISDKIASLQQTYKAMKLDSTLYGLRKKAGVTFLQNDFKDDRDQDPVAMLKKADSLRDTGMVDEAEKLYTTLSQDLVFSPEGKKALVELAKIQTERQFYQQAVNNYRNYLLYTPDDGKRCNTFFMIGFIYDEHLNNPEEAEVNYKWILKNSPDCDLADDAEFMVLHLDEPMSSVEELRAEALRQGRKIESFDDDVAAKQDSSKAPATAKAN